MVVTEEEEYFDTKLIEQPRHKKIKQRNSLGLDGLDLDEEPEAEIIPS